MLCGKDEMKEKEEIVPKRNILFFLNVKEASLITASGKKVNSFLAINGHICNSQVLACFRNAGVNFLTDYMERKHLWV